MIPQLRVKVSWILAATLVFHCVGVILTLLSSLCTCPRETDLCGERQERDYCGTPMLNSGRWFSESESEWLEIEVNSASLSHDRPGETVSCGEMVEEEERRGSDGVTHLGWTKLVWHLNASGSKTGKTMTHGQVWRRVLLHGTEEDGNIDADKIETIFRCCNELEEWFKENRAEQQHQTSSDGWKLSSTGVERRCTELTTVCDGFGKTAKEAKVIEVSETGKALPDQRDGRKPGNETRTVLDRLMGSRAQLPSGSETVEHDNNEG